MNRMALAVLIGGAIATATPGAQAPKVNADAQLLQDFTKRIEAYMDLHNRLEKKAPPLKTTEDPATIKASREGLSAAIRAERAHAKQGEIFTPQIAAIFRRLMYPEVKGPEGAETKKAMKEDAPKAGTVPIKVNATYPEGAPLPSVPPNVLANLPKLPEDLEYRVIGRNLLLRDVHANLIVDYLPNAIQ
jgi:hypothetical protein